MFRTPTTAGASSALSLTILTSIPPGRVVPRLIMTTMTAASILTKAACLVSEPHAAQSTASHIHLHPILIQLISLLVFGKLNKTLKTVPTTPNSTEQAACSVTTFIITVNASKCAAHTNTNDNTAAVPKNAPATCRPAGARHPQTTTSWDT